MKIIKNSGIFLLIISLLLVFGCSSSKGFDSVKESGTADGYQHSKYEYNSYDDGSVEIIATESSGDTANYLSDISENTAIIETGENSVSSTNKILEERKIIRNANITLEVEDFEKAYSKIEYLISNIGFIQESRINKEKHYINSEEILLTSGVIIVRVEAAKFSTVLKDIKGLGLLIEENIKSDDVTEKFFDVESRLRVVRYQESRLEEYLKKVEDPDIIFKTEKQLTEIRHEIETLTGTLNKLNDLVELSTITINMDEKLPYEEKPEKEEESYLGKLKQAFLESFEEVVDFCAEFIIGVVAALPALFLLGIIFIIVFLIYKRFIRKKIKQKSDKKLKYNDKISGSNDEDPGSNNKDSDVK